MEQTKRELKPEMLIRIMQMISKFFVACVLIMGAILLFVLKTKYDPNMFVESLKNPVYVVLFSMGVLLLAIRVPIANRILAESLERVKPQGLPAVLVLYFAPFILKLALADSVAILGFIFSRLSGELSPFLILGAAAIITILKEVPTLDKIKERVRAINPQIQF